MRATLSAALLIVVPQIGLALSCRPHSVEAVFQEAQASQSEFVVVKGQLNLDAGPMPDRQEWQGEVPEDAVLQARLTGHSLSKAGFVTPFDRPVTVIAACYGSWCATVDHGAQVLAFVETGAKGRVVTATPCGGYVFGNPTAQMLGTVQQCFAGATCMPSR